IGWDTYKKKWSKYVNIDKPVYGTDPNDLELNPHSSYLKIISELGLVGLLLFTFCLLLLLNKTLSYLLRDDFTAYFGILFIIIFHGFFDNNSYGNERIFYIIVGSIFAKIYYLNVAKSTLLDYQPTGKI
ncbi:MAG TPA: hypothetical protein VN642_19720, partial [Dongiaceae bacterium]|nr:hypothetical protein [Dongiaceae bacterium]